MNTSHPLVTDLDRHLKHLKIERLVAESFLAFIILSIAGSVGYFGYTRSHVGAKVVLGKDNISFKGRGEVADLVSKNTKDLELTFSLPDKRIVKKAEEIGIAVDPEATLDQIFENKELTLASAKSAAEEGYKGKRVEYAFTVDEKKFTIFTDLLSSESKALPRNAGVVFRDNKFEITPDEPGRELDRENLSSVLTDALGTLSTTIDVPLKRSPAAISTAVATKAAEKGESMASRSVTLKVDGNAFKPSKAEVAEWIDFKPENTDYNVYVDRVLVGGYLINNIGAKHNDAYREVNTDTATGAVADLLQQGKDVELEVPFISKLSRPPQAWGKYVEVNLSKQWFYAIANGRVEIETGVSTGRRANATPAGIMQISKRLRMRDMTGGDPPNTFILHVPHVQYFTNRGHAIHGTYWHNEFGYRSYRGPYGRSHGCVNLPLSVAANFWEWNRDLGLPVWIHY